MKVDERLIELLTEQLKKAVRDTRHIETAQIQIIDLGAVRRRAGRLWPELAGRVRETALHFIEHRVGPHDVVIPAGDGFVAIYEQADDASAKAQALQTELDRFYLGEDWTGERAAVSRRSG